jgi:hypothetical protein
MAKKSQIQAAIESLEDDIGMLQIALTRLKQVQSKAQPRKPPRVVKKDEKVSA